MKKLLFLILVIFYGKCFACQCHRIELKKELKYTSAIAHVKVLKIEYVSRGSIFSDAERKHLEENSQAHILDSSRSKSVAKVEVEIIVTYKGSFDSEKLTIYTSKHGQSCGYLGFELGKDFIVFLSPERLSKRLFENYINLNNPNRLWTNRCSRTTVFDEVNANEIVEGLKSLN